LKNHPWKNSKVIPFVFWAKQHKKKTPLWNEAVTYCQAHEEKPNCHSVMLVLIITNGATDIPKYGSSGHALVTSDLR
jgi:hypothetical protein